MTNYAIKSERAHTISQLLKAYTMFNRDEEYVVIDGQVKIVDEQTKNKQSISDYEYEMLIDDNDTPFEINTWIPIATDRIKDISRIDEYISKGLIRKIDSRP